MNLNADSISYSRRITEYIQSHEFTSERPVTAPELGRVFGVHPSFIRGCVNLSRCLGMPVCSNAKGYWYSEDRSEIQATIDHLQERVEKQQNAINGLKAAIGG